MLEKTRFLIHLHEARRAGTHWDLRILRNGVLVSWAIPRAKEPNRGDRFLAIRTPDHPLSWEKFEGNIPSKEYGGGVVKIYDKGTCKINEWKDGKIGFTLEGEKVKGDFWLIRIENKKNQTKDWLWMRSK